MSESSADEAGLQRADLARWCYACGEMTPYEVLLASQWLGLKHIIVSHYMDPDCKDVKEFVRLVEAADRKDGLAPKLSVPKPGETIKILS